MADAEVLVMLQSWLAARPGVVLEIHGNEIALRWSTPDGTTRVLPALVPSGYLGSTIAHLLRDYERWQQLRERLG